MAGARDKNGKGQAINGERLRDTLTKKRSPKKTQMKMLTLKMMTVLLISQSMIPFKRQNSRQLLVKKMHHLSHKEATF